MQAAAAAEATDRTAKTFTLAAGTPIHVDATIAEVTITGSSRPDVSIEIVRHAPTTGDLATFPAVVEERPDGLYVSAVQADGGRDANLRSDITISAPPTAVFQSVRVVEGHVKLLNLRAACDVNLQRGPIDATALAGRVRLEAGIGSVDVKQSGVDAGRHDAAPRLQRRRARAVRASAGERPDPRRHLQRLAHL